MLQDCINLSPTWFQQGQNVGQLSDAGQVYKFSMQGDTGGPKVSSLLKTSQENNRARAWLNVMQEHAALLTASLVIMHPEMYAAGQEAMIWLSHWTVKQDDPDLWEVFPMWILMYNVISIMVNQASPFYTDVNGCPQWLDLLLTIGNYANLDFVIPTIRYQLWYNQGTILGLSG